MKRVIVALGVLATLASVAWLGWAVATQRAVTGWLDAREAEGWVVERGELDVTGFPARVVIAFHDMSLADPQSGLVWSAPGLTLRQPAFRPDKVEVIWPPSQTLSSPFETLRIGAGRMTTSLDVQPAANFALDLSETRMDALEIDSSLGWQSRLGAGRLDMRRVEGTPATYALAFEATEVTPPEDLARLLDPAGVLPEAIPVVRSEAVVAFDRPWDLSAIQDARPQPVRIDLAEARAEWGSLLLRMSGRVDVDAQGHGTGEIAIRAENWPEMLAMAERAGLLGPGARRTAERALGLLARLSGREEDLDVTLRLDDGFVYLGPLPVGEGPRLRLR